ncbi:hypothetical protein N7527_003786 [Penicillium freii]|nr:hypothetical protein N7527_003786 [Penicillium freii]
MGEMISTEQVFNLIHPYYRPVMDPEKNNILFQAQTLKSTLPGYVFKITTKRIYHASDTPPQRDEDRFPRLADCPSRRRLSLALVSQPCFFFGFGLCVVLIKDICNLNKRDARKTIPQGLLTRRWEVADRHAAKQHKKLEKMQKKKKKKKWYATIQRPGHYLQWSCYN